MGHEQSGVSVVDNGFRLEPSSFRDPASRVFYADGQVLRGLRAEAIDDWNAVANSEFFGRLVAEGKICGTEPAGADIAVAERQDKGWSEVLRHERVPFVSYPYEWTFGMLRDAALVHLEVLLAALPDGVITKDGSAYNMQWRGSAPMFIDVGSFERMRPGEPWAGYRQFCQTFLYPLMLQSHLGLHFNSWLRGQLDGVEPDQMRALFRGFKRFKAGVFKNVHLHGAMQAKFANSTATSTRTELADAGFRSELVKATIKALEKLVGKLDWQPRPSGWSDYRATCTYSDDDAGRKMAFVDRALADGNIGLAIDLGANDGAYSRIAAKHADYVLAVESDAETADAMYRQLRDESERRILPLVVDLASPSPGIGWRGKERLSFDERAEPDAVLALAVLHHLAIGRNIPMAELIDWLAQLGGRLVVEFVHPDDPMSQRLLANKPAGLFDDYRRDVFERLLGERYEITAREELPSGTRTLYVGELRG